MKKIIFLFKFFSLVTFVSLFTNACSKKEDAFDELSREMGGASNSYIYSGTAVTLNDLAFPQETDNYVGIPIVATEKVNKPDSVFAVVDTSLIIQYNTLYSENNLIIRTDNFEPSNNGIFHFGTDSIKSTDSMYVNIKNANGLIDGATYLVPLRVSSNGSVKLKQSVYFIKYTVSLKAIMSSISASIYNYSTTSSFSVYGAYSSPFVAGVSIYQSALSESNNPIFGSVIAKINTPFSPHDVTIGVQLDNTDSMIQRYYNIYPYASYSNYSTLPEGSISIQNSVLHVVKGSTISYDSARFVITNPNLLTVGKYYLTAISLKQNSSDPIYGAPNDTTYTNKTVFVTVTLNSY